MSRLGPVVAVAVASFTLACGGSDSREPPVGSAVTEPEGNLNEAEAEAVTDPEWGLSFSIAGRETPMTARAELQVVEGDPEVHVAITGRTTGTDVLIIDLTFDGLENTVGPHEVPFSLPPSGDHVANGSLDGTWYYSQGGTIEFTLESQGRIQGSFDIALARGELGTLDEPVVFEADAEAVPLRGEFSGSWVLNCHSRLAGHSVLVRGGEFCEDLHL